MNPAQRQRLCWRLAFFALFLLAPPLDLFRLDLTAGHFVLFGHPWVLDLHDVPASVAVVHLITRAFLPLLLLVGLGFWLAWRYGRLYCGWLCPHFSVVELINNLMRHASGKPSLWERRALPSVQADGTHIEPQRRWWWLVGLAVVGFSALWAVTLLTYLLPPAQVWGNLLHGTPTRNQGIFLAVATALLVIEFTLARHLFCRYGCAVGLFKSLIWMANPRARGVHFERRLAARCAGCDQSCEHACPMRLKPRQIKRKLLTCTQCQACVQACARVNTQGSATPLTVSDGYPKQAAQGHGIAAGKTA